jgi:hypothetical protein
MAKRGQNSKDKRKAERERQKRWGQQQKNLHFKQLQRDLRYFEENGLMTTEDRWEEAIFQALEDSANWRSEVEFRELAFDPYTAGQAMNQVWRESPLTPDELEKMPEEERDERAFEANARAIELILTPEFKKIFLQRLDRFRLRLRAAKHWDTLAQASAVQIALETSEQSNDVPLWPECDLIYQLHYEAVGEYLRLQDAAQAALDSAYQQIDRACDTPEDLLTEEETDQVQNALEQAAAQTPGLMEFLTRAADEAVDDALALVHSGEISCQLFTADELRLFLAYFVAALASSSAGQSAPEDLPPAERARVDEQINDAIADCLDQFDTPERRAALYRDAQAALDKLAQSTEDKELIIQINLLLPLLEEDAPLAENDFFVSAIMGEFGLYMESQQDAEADDLADAAP